MKKIIPCKLLVAICFIVFAFTVNSCHKEGLGGNGSINGTVYHHEVPIPNCTVYLKFNTSEFPGESPANYDTYVGADAKGAYNFTKVYKGDYYLYAVGYDQAIMDIVRGGVPVTAKRNKSVTQDIPVTED